MNSRLRLLAPLALGLALAACSNTSSYMGVPFVTQAEQEPAAADRPSDLVVLMVALAWYERACADTDDTSPACLDALREVAAAFRGERATFATLPIGALAQFASIGIKPAQLELGMRFEEGRGGVACDPAKARKLYRKAASSSGGTIWVYQPPVGNGTSGRTVPLDTGPREAGLPAAAERLAALERRLDEGGGTGQVGCRAN